MTRGPIDHRTRPLLSLVEHGSALGQSAQMARRLAELTALMTQETRLVDELSDLLRRQRAGLTAADAETVSAGAQAIGRNLLMLDTARELAANQNLSAERSRLAMPSSSGSSPERLAARTRRSRNRPSDGRHECWY